MFNIKTAPKMERKMKAFFRRGEPRCKHLNGDFVEVMTATHMRTVSNGEADKVGYNDMGNITHYEFHCSDCETNFRFSCREKAPKWMHKYFDAL